MINDYFDKIFIVNLDTRKDRMELIKKSLDKLGIYNYERFQAIRPKRSSIKESTFKNSRSLSKKGLFSGIRKPLLRGLAIDKYIVGMSGCKMSHVEIVKISKKRGYSKILIFEDDVSFNRDFNSIFNKTIERIDRIGWDVLYFGANHIKPCEIIDKNIASAKYTLSTIGYALSSSTFDFIIDNAMSSGKEIDVFYADSLIKNFKALAFEPNIIYCELGFSDIMGRESSFGC
tara:strand:- start:1398 stop:2090 length:693 start_codon:yes stop_codon:yes gene_type:complete